MTLEHTDEAKKIYNSGKWKKLRNSYMAQVNYICERCGSAASIVHHKIYINADNVNDPNITLSKNNLEALCYDCHNKEHFATDEVVVDGLGFDIYGNLIKISKNEK